MPSIYDLKPKFQDLLRPMVRQAAAAGVTANQVTVAACALSLGLGVWLCLPGTPPKAFLALPLLLFVRMALNAVDGMLAREFGQKSALGAYLNELCDVVADSFLYLPFAFQPGFGALETGAVILLSAVSELAGVLGLMAGASRRYDGPMGKSDRAFWFGLAALLYGLAGTASPLAAYVFMSAMALLLMVTIANRVRRGLAEARAKGVR